MTWAQHAKALTLSAQFLLARWKCPLPSHDSLPSPALEREIDEWCGELAKDLMAELDPPELVKPWMIARLLAMSGVAELLASRGDLESPKLNEETLCRFLIENWHEVLRDQWPLFMQLDGE